MAKRGSRVPKATPAQISNPHPWPAGGQASHPQGWNSTPRMAPGMVSQEGGPTHQGDLPQRCPPTKLLV